MAKKLGTGELEFLRGENRQLKKLVKQLSKRIGRGNKEYNKLVANVDLEREKVEVPEQELETAVRCENCNKRVIVVDMGTRLVMNCLSCNTRKTKRK